MRAITRERKMVGAKSGLPGGGEGEAPKRGK